MVEMRSTYRIKLRKVIGELPKMVWTLDFGFV